MRLRSFGCPHGRESSSAYALADSSAWHGSAGCRARDRGRALEIVDEHGCVRTEIKVRPTQPKLKMPDGTTGYPEAVQLRLFSSQNSPNVKLVTTEDGTASCSAATKDIPNYCHGARIGSSRLSTRMVGNRP